MLKPLYRLQPLSKRETFTGQPLCFDPLHGLAALQKDVDRSHYQIIARGKQCVSFGFFLSVTERGGQAHDGSRTELAKFSFTQFCNPPPKEFVEVCWIWGADLSRTTSREPIVEAGGGGGFVGSQHACKVRPLTPEQRLYKRMEHGQFLFTKATSVLNQTISSLITCYEHYKHLDPLSFPCRANALVLGPRGTQTKHPSKLSRNQKIRR